MLEYINRFEKAIYYLLMFLLAVVLTFAVIELLYLIYLAIFTDVTNYRLDNYEILDLFGYFLLILIGIELLETIKAYIVKNEIHVEIIILLALIAVARKIILLDPLAPSAGNMTYLTMIGLGVIVIALGGTYYLVKKVGITV